MKNLKKLRKEYRLSQQKLADILHVSQQSVYKYENDITSPDIETLIRMADFFNTSIDYLVEHTDISHKIEPVEDVMLNKEEASFIRNYRKLTAKQKHLLNEIAEDYENEIKEFFKDCAIDEYKDAKDYNADPWDYYGFGTSDFV